MKARISQPRSSFPWLLLVVPAAWQAEYTVWLSEGEGVLAELGARVLPLSFGEITEKSDSVRLCQRQPQSRTTCAGPFRVICQAWELFPMVIAAKSARWLFRSPSGSCASNAITGGKAVRTHPQCALNLSQSICSNATACRGSNLHETSYIANG